MSDLLLLLAVSLFPSGDEQIFSGPQPGESLPPLVIQGAGGSQTEKEFDVMEKAGDKPVVIVFVHQRTRPAFGLANTVMRLVEDHGPEKAVGGLIYLNDDITEAVGWMNRVRTYFPTGVQKGVCVDGSEGPGAYGLNSNVAMTVLVGSKKKVTANFALVQPSLEVDAPKIFKAICEALGEKEVPRVAKYSNSGRMRDDPVDGKLRALLRPLIQKDASEDDVVAAAKKIEALAAKDRQARKQIGIIAGRIVSAGKLANYGTAKCQEYLKKWAKEFESTSSDRSGTQKAKREASDQASEKE